MNPFTTIPSLHLQLNHLSAYLKDRVELSADDVTTSMTNDFFVAYLSDLIDTELHRCAPDDQNLEAMLAQVQQITAAQLEADANMHAPIAAVGDYLTIASALVAPDFAFGAQLGAQVAGAPVIIGETAADVATNIGLAFQIKSELYDLLGFGGTTTMGPMRLIKDGQFTLPAVFAASADPGLIHRYGVEGSESDLEKVAMAVIEGGSEAAQDVATDYRKQALFGLTDLPAGPARDQLKQLITMVV